MANTATYALKGYGNIDPGWVRECFGLFKAQDVCIRKLLLLKSGNASSDTGGFSMLEIHFALPLADETLEAHPFLAVLNGRLDGQDWTERTLNRI
jgi:hypothetical protein